jgi:hypothetical protein
MAFSKSFYHANRSRVIGTGERKQIEPHSYEHEKIAQERRPNEPFKFGNILSGTQKI